MQLLYFLSLFNFVFEESLSLSVLHAGKKAFLGSEELNSVICNHRFETGMLSGVFQG